jgi:pyruvate/2-oxoglutarate dehydrogenase complex dihydrolipoamide acyltransferase (E2) component
MDVIGKFEKVPFPKKRDLVIDAVALAKSKHHVPILLEIDVSRARDSIRKYELQTGKQISFTGWIAKCIAQAVSEQPQVHALRSGKRSLVLFNDVDILIPVQKQTSEGEMPLTYILRKANQKTVYEINDEMRLAQAQEANSLDMVLGKNTWYASIYLRLPRFIRYALGRMLLRNPYGIKRNSGTIGISSIDMMGNFGGWAIPTGPLPLQFGIGSISRKPWVINDEIQIREVLNLAFVFDHDVIDGTPIARFIGRLTELMQNGDGLPQLEGSS